MWDSHLRWLNSQCRIFWIYCQSTKRVCFQRGRGQEALLSCMETVRNHHPSASSGSVITSCEWIKADGFWVSWYLFNVSLNYYPTLAGAETIWMSYMHAAHTCVLCSLTAGSNKNIWCRCWTGSAADAMTNSSSVWWTHDWRSAWWLNISSCCPV